MEGVIRWLELNGFNRASTVRESGDYAVRGGILDLFASGMDLPVRLDFFGDTLETIRSFDPETQRTVMEMRALDLVPVSEFQLMTDTIRKFRTGYVAAFGAADPEDMLYEAVSEGRRYPGMEHWLPLFHDKLDTLFDYAARRAGDPGKPRGRRRARAARADQGLLRGAQGRARRTQRHALQAAAAGPALSAGDRMGRAAEHRGAGAVDAVRGAGGGRREQSMSARGPGTIFPPSGPRMPRVFSMR